VKNYRQKINIVQILKKHLFCIISSTAFILVFCLYCYSSSKIGVLPTISIIVLISILMLRCIIWPSLNRDKPNLYDTANVLLQRRKPRLP
jgi:hypothetical protein